jgi:hypothetical protein
MNFMKSLFILKHPIQHPSPLQPILRKRQLMHGMDPDQTPIIAPPIPPLQILNIGVLPLTPLPGLSSSQTLALTIVIPDLHGDNIKVFAKSVAFKATQPNDVSPFS